MVASLLKKKIQGFKNFSGGRQQINIYGFEQELGASYGAKRLCDNEDVYGIGIIKVDDEKSYLI